MTLFCLHILGATSGYDESGLDTEGSNLRSVGARAPRFFLSGRRSSIVPGGPACPSTSQHFFKRMIISYHEFQQREKGSESSGVEL